MCYPSLALPAIASMPTAIATAYLLEILETTPSPLAMVDHATGNSFINNIQKTDDEKTILEKVDIWYRDMVGALAVAYVFKPNRQTFQL